MQCPVLQRKEYRHRSGVALTENIDLPQSGNKKRKVVDDLIRRWNRCRQTAFCEWRYIHSA